VDATILERVHSYLGPRLTFSWRNLGKKHVYCSRYGCYKAPSYSPCIIKRGSFGRNTFSFAGVIISLKYIYSLSDRTAKAILWLL